MPASTSIGPDDAVATKMRDLVANLDGTINPAVDDFIREGIARARLEGAKFDGAIMPDGKRRE